jgi:signal transduction histidine kinase
MLLVAMGLLLMTSGFAQVQADDDLIMRTLDRVNKFRTNNQNDSALYELITLNRKLKNSGRESGYVYVDIGNLYFHLKLDNMAKRFYAKANTIFVAQHDLIGQSIVLENLGGLHSRQQPGSDSVAHYYTQALRLQEQAGDSFYAAHSQRALALYYSHNGNRGGAHRHITAALRAIQNKGIEQHPRYRWDVQFIPQQVYLTASDIFRHEKRDYDSAELYLKKAIAMTARHGIPEHRVRYTTFLAIFYLEQQMWPKALTAINEALTLADSLGYVWGKVGALQALRNYYHQTKNTQKETEAAYQYLLYKDRMYNERNDDELIVMSNLILQYENELEIQQQQNLLKEQERINHYQQRQFYFLLAIVSVLMIGLLMISYLYRSLRKRTKQANQYLAELQTSNETMRTLLSVISHDVRAPFNSLLGLSKVTLMETDLPADEYRQRVTMMHDTSAKGLILLDNLLQWVALQRDGALITLEPVSLAAVVNETLNDLAAVALTQHVRIEKNIAVDACRTDKQALKVIVRNLLTNAIKYSSGKTVTLLIEPTAEGVVLRVRDQGPGIPDEILEQLFAAGDMKKIAAKGGGLGLKIVKELVTKLHGTIEATNLPGGGAQFSVYLPQ